MIDINTENRKEIEFSTYDEWYLILFYVIQSPNHFDVKVILIGNVHIHPLLC